jgi:hypothetical protein
MEKEIFWSMGDVIALIIITLIIVSFAMLYLIMLVKEKINHWKWKRKNKL